MSLDDINKIVELAAEKKDFANSNTINKEFFNEAKELYLKAYDLCAKHHNISEEQRFFLTSIYKYEALDCDYIYNVAIANLNDAQSNNADQKTIVETLLGKYSLVELTDTQHRKWYQDFIYKKITIEFQAFQPFAKKYFRENNFTKAIYYYRRSEEVMARVNISSLTEGQLQSYNKNFHIIKFNISQCQVGIYSQEIEEDELLAKKAIKGFLQGIDETEKLLSLGYDVAYDHGLSKLKEYIESVLAQTKVSWAILLDLNNDHSVLMSLMKKNDKSRYTDAINRNKLLNVQEDRFLFYTHGFNTRGKWKGPFTEIITSKSKNSSIHFTMLPWDYGTFIIQFIIPCSRRRVIEEFKEECLRIDDRYGKDIKKCLVAHSFGTYLTGTALQESPLIKFERIIYLGGIISVDFDWNKLKTNGQCDKVLFEQSTNDLAVLGGQLYRKIFRWVKWIGNAGRKGFSKNYNFMAIRTSRSGHSGMINETNISGPWFDFLIS